MSVTFFVTFFRDDWEMFFLGDLNSDGSDDNDQDGIPSAQEFNEGTSPGSQPSTADFDGDGLPDCWELMAFGNLNQSGSDDTDGDGVRNGSEYIAGTNPAVAEYGWLTAVITLIL